MYDEVASTVSHVSEKRHLNRVSRSSMSHAPNTNRLQILHGEDTRVLVELAAGGVGTSSEGAARWQRKRLAARAPPSGWALGSFVGDGLPLSPTRLLDRARAIGGGGHLRARLRTARAAARLVCRRRLAGMCMRPWRGVAVGAAGRTGMLAVGASSLAAELRVASCRRCVCVSVRPRV